MMRRAAMDDVAVRFYQQVSMRFGVARGSASGRAEPRSRERERL
jgi:hypothetical protein